MPEVSHHKETQSEVIYFDDLEGTKKEIIDAFERSPNPILWTSEIVENVSASRPTVLKHLNELREAGLVDKKENVDTVWWLGDEAEIWPGSKSGFAETLNRWITTSVQTGVERWINRAAVFGAVLVLLGMFILITAAYMLANEVQPPTILGMHIFSVGLSTGVIGFSLLSLKASTFISEVIVGGIQLVRRVLYRFK